MARAHETKLTAECLYDLPDDDRRYELVRGYLVEEPRPTVGHGRVASRVSHLLMQYMDEHPVGEVVCCDPGFILARDPDTVRGPDVAVLLHENYPEDDNENKFVTGAPDLAVEVLSRSDRPSAVAAKARDYLRAGATCVWVVDPRKKSVQVLRDAAEPVTLTGAQPVVLPDLLPGFEVAAAEFFRYSAAQRR